MLRSLCYVSLARVVGQPLIGPVGFEIGGEDEDAELGEAEIVERREGRAKVGAMVQRAAPAINNEIRGAREGSGPGLNLCEPLGVVAAAMVLSAFNVAGDEKARETHKEYDGSRLGIGKFLIQIGRLDGLRIAPGVNAILREG